MAAGMGPGLVHAAGADEGLIVASKSPGAVPLLRLVILIHVSMVYHSGNETAFAPVLLWRLPFDSALDRGGC
jgi:hypothetical protein